MVLRSRRTTELTAAMLQLVASGRGLAALPPCRLAALPPCRLAALPHWAVQAYLQRGHVTARPIGAQGLTGKLYLACRTDTADQAWLPDFVDTTRETCFMQLAGVQLL